MITIEAIGKGQSLFSFISKYCMQEEANGATEESQHRRNKPLHRLCNLMRKMNVQTVVIEGIDTQHSSVADEVVALNAYYKENKLKIYRFTFIASKISIADEIEKLEDDQFLSSAILINYVDTDNIWHSYLYRAIVTIPKIITRDESDLIKTFPLLNNYPHIYKPFRCEVELSTEKSVKFNIVGIFFCQQNGRTYSCAHANLCMTINNMHYPMEKMIVPEDINKKINIDHVNTKLDENAGLTSDQIMGILADYGLSIRGVNFFEQPNIQYDDYIYNYVESRCPVLLIFRTGDKMSHVVSVSGHTLNSDIWKSDAEPAYSREPSRLPYKSASAWVDNFIIHDDNFGMYLCLPVDSLKRRTSPKEDPTFRAEIAIAIIPSDVTTPANEASIAAALIVRDTISDLHANKNIIEEWTDRIRRTPKKSIVIRTLLVSKADYMQNLKLEDFQEDKFSEKEQEQLVRDLPDRFWLSEMTLSDLYTTNKSKIIDFFYGCSNPPLNQETLHLVYSRWIQIRFPGSLIKRIGTPSNDPIRMSVKSHYPLFRFRGINQTSDW